MTGWLNGVTGGKVPGLGDLLGGATNIFSGWNDERKFKGKMDDLQDKLKVLPEGSIKIPADDKPSDLLKFVQNGLNVISGSQDLKTDGKQSPELLAAINKYTTDKGGPEIASLDQLTGTHLREILKDMREKKILVMDNPNIKPMLEGLGKALHEIENPDIKKFADELAPKKNKPVWGADAGHGDITVASKGGHVAPDDDERRPDNAAIAAYDSAAEQFSPITSVDPRIAAVVGGEPDEVAIHYAKSSAPSVGMKP